MASKTLEIRDLRGGRNGADPPLSLPDNQAVEMLNVDQFDGMIARKRGGASSLSLTGGTTFTTDINSLVRFVPGNSEASSELFAADGASTPLVKRLTGGTTWADVTVGDPISASQQIVATTFNGKLYYAYNCSTPGGVDRLHCYDPSLSSPNIRRVGFATPAAPTAADTGAGAWPATLAYYRVRWLQLDGTRIVRMSEPSASVSFTPSGGGTHTRITRPTAASESETHWMIEKSSNNAVFYRSPTNTAIATTTFDDNVAMSTWQTYTQSEQTGLFSTWPSVRYLLTDGNRLLGAYAWVGTGALSLGKYSRVWFSPVLGSTDQGDDERVPNATSQKNWVDLNENDGGGITGLGGPIYGVPYAFKRRQVWKLNPTGDVAAPYLPRKVADGSYGTVSHHTIVTATDSNGNPALYFWGPDGPCRIAIVGGAVVPQYLGRDIEDINVNYAATSGVFGHGVYHQAKHQVWWWVSTGSNTEPDTRLVFDVHLGRFIEGDRIRGGWYKHTGKSAEANTSVMYGNTIGSTTTLDLKPYVGWNQGLGILKCDTSDTSDDSVTFQAYVKTKPMPIAVLGTKVGLGQSSLVAKAQSGVTITQTLDRDFGLETRTSTVSLTAAASETRVIRKFEGSDMAQADTIQVQLGDASAVANTWTLDAWSAPVHTEGTR